MKLFLVRHGQSVWNLENRFTGWKDVDLTPLGEEEAHKAAALLRNEKVEEAFTSVLIRAQRTLDIIMEDNGWTSIPVIKNRALNERSYGDLEGLNKADTAKKYGAEQVHLWRRSFEVQPPGGESLKDTCDRVIPYYESHIKPELARGKNIIIVAHGNSLRALIMYLEKLTPGEILKREIATGQPLTYSFDEKMTATPERLEG